VAADDQLIAWLDRAIARLNDNPTAKLPAIPVFGPTQVARATHKSPATHPIERNSKGPVHVVRRPASTSGAHITKAPAKRPVEVIARPLVDSGDVGVDAAELNSHIAGYNLAAASITAKLAAMDHPAIELLTEIVDELEELSQRQSTLALYIGLLDPTEAQLIGTPKPLEPVISVVASKIYSLRQAIENRRLSAAEATRLRQRLSGLSKRLAQLGNSGHSDASSNAFN
jgi:hypothetical protein